METKQLITFITLAKKQSYQKASDLLNYAPSTVAKQIRALEEELNTELVKRNGMHIELTDDGNKFLSHATLLLEDYNEMLRDFCIIPEKGADIRIAGGEPLVGFSFSDMLLDFFREKPEVRPSVEMICCSNIPKMIADNKVDIGYVHDMNILKHANLNVVPLYREEVCLVSAPQNPLSGKEYVDYDDLRGKSFAFTYEDCSFCYEFSNRMRDKKVVPKSVLFLGSYMSVLNCVRNDDRITLIPSTSLPRILADGFVRLKWAKEPLLPWVQLLYSAAKPVTSVQKELISRTIRMAQQRITICGKNEVVDCIRH